MTIKRSKIIAVFGIFILSFLFHFAYQVFPNTLFSIFFPVNESIWEHMKMLYTSIIFYGIIDYFILVKTDKNNFLFQLFITAISSIPIYLIIYLPLYYVVGENMIISITLLFIIIIISQIISYYILKYRDLGKLNTISIFLIALVFIIMGYLTYKPIKTDLFFDHKDEKYGINDYQV